MQLTTTMTMMMMWCDFMRT